MPSRLPDRPLTLALEHGMAGLLVGMLVWLLFGLIWGIAIGLTVMGGLARRRIR